MSSTARIKLRGDTAAAWTAANPTLQLREVGLETDTRRFKVGDGTTAWSGLSYFAEPATAAFARGQASRTTSGTISVGTQGTYVTTGLTATLDTATASGMSLGTTDLFGLKNTSGSTKLMLVHAILDMHAGNNQTLGIKLAKNGTAIDATESRAISGTVETSYSTNWLISLAANDEVSVLVTNHSNTTSIACARGRIVATEVRG